MINRIYALSFTLLILCFMGWLFSHVLDEEVLPVGSNLPVLEFNSSFEKIEIKQNNKPLIIVYFNTSCEHCQYQLNVFDQHIREFQNADIYFFTSESDFFQNNSTIEWENLNKAQNATFGIVSKDSFEKSFGSIMTPSHYFFDTQGKLNTKIRGELKSGKVIAIIKSLMSGRAQ